MKHVNKDKLVYYTNETMMGVKKLIDLPLKTQNRISNIIDKNFAIITTEQTGNCPRVWMGLLST